MKLVQKLAALTLAAGLLLIPGLSSAEEMEEVPVQTYTEEEQQTLAARFKSLPVAQCLKAVTYDAPVMTQRFGADPFALVYDGRVYLYMTGDTPEYNTDGTVKNNTYSRINTLNVISSADLINWTDHGWVKAAGYNGAAKWGSNSWAPAAACKEIDGKMKFFLYFANGGNGIGVLQADSPTGPFTDPLGRALISRSTPNCANVTWLFDPAVFVDEDGSAYIYFGGGIPQGKEAAPGTARVAKLGADMISLACEPVALDVPYLFEDSGINRIGDTYYYSYCSNWQVPDAARRKYGFDNAQIVYMTASDPMGPFTLGGMILKNPGTYYGCYGNNHHCMFQFKGEWYIAYHTQILEKPMGISGGYRSTSISKLRVNADGSIATLHTVKQNMLAQVGTFDPYQRTGAATMCTNAGISTKPADPARTCGDMVLCDIQPGEWVALRGVDFGEGASTFTATIRRKKGAGGAMAIQLDKVRSQAVGYLTWDGAEEDDEVTLTAKLTGECRDVHNLFISFDGEGYEVVSWQFGR